MASVLDAGEFGHVLRAQQQGEAQAQQQQGSQFSQSQSQFSPKRQEQERQRQHEEEPVPEYRDYEPTSHSQVFDYPGAMPPGPPPGAAAPVVGSVWAGESHNNNNTNNNNNSSNFTPGHGMRGTSRGNLGVEEGGGDRTSQVSEDFGLAYMNMGPGDDEAPLEGEGEKERQARLSKHVRFGDTSEFMQPPEAPYMTREPSPSSPSPRNKRVPPPSADPVQDERALNAAAAREVSRELDALNFSPPPAPPQVQVQTDGQWEQQQQQQQPPSPPKTREFSPPRSREYTSSPPPQNQYQPPSSSPPQAQYAPAPPANQYAPPPQSPSTQTSPRLPSARKATTDNNTLPPGAGHHSTPSWDPPAQPQPQPAFAPGHHTTPSWALSPAPPSDGPASPSSPRLDSPYRAPIAARSTSSLNTQVPPGARTISAAAFRRPQKTGSASEAQVADTSPLALKKRLPASPYPQQRGGSTLRDVQQAPPPQQQQEEDSFDYISAYANGGGRESQAFHDDGSPMQSDFDYGRLGKVGVVGGTPASPGYSAGRFATDLDPDGLR
ncbi:hypothetical protein DFH06DRAFT_561497 [Mycena polygramma]|nr:hypothetical protein DFH06DRAFT_561497 [Mycena polygramma]